MSTLVDTSVGGVEVVSRWCRLTPVSTVSTVSRECRDSVESVEPGLKLQRTRSFLRRSVATEPALAAALVGFGTCQTLGVRQRPYQAAGGRAALRTGFARERVVAGRPSTPLFSTSESNIVVPVEVSGHQQSFFCRNS